MNNPLPSKMILLLPLVMAMSQGPAHAQEKPVYKCPGNFYTDTLSAKEAQSKGCKTIEGAPITIIQGFKPKPAVKNNSTPPPNSGKTDNQKARDADARLILEAELKKEEESLAALRNEYKNGQPDRLGEERQANKYNERVQNLKNSIDRKEADIASIKRELSKLGPAPTPTAAPTTAPTPLPIAQTARFLQ